MNYTKSERNVDNFVRPFLTRKFFEEILGLEGSRNFLGKFRQVHNLKISGRLLRSKSFFQENIPRFIIIIIISAHKSDLSYPWSQTQASLSIPSLHPKNTNKRRERKEKNNRRENLPRSDRRGREEIKQEQKNKSKDPPRISERQIDKQARQTKCQDHTNCRYRTRVAKHTPPVAGRGAADSQALRQGAPV